MDLRVNCPICGQTAVDSLQEHLQSHTKQSLIDILLAQQHQICRQHITRNPTLHVVSRNEDSPEKNPRRCDNETRNANHQGQILVEFPTVPAHRHSGSHEPLRSKAKAPPGDSCSIPSSEANNTQSSVLRLDFNPNGSTETHILPHEPPAPRCQTRIVSEIKIEKNSVALTKSSTTSTGKPTFVLVDHSPCKPGPSRRRSLEEAGVHQEKSTVSDAPGGVQPNTSIIQYIIDESGQINDSPQEQPDSWILADGRTIPVYSSLTQVPAVSDATPSCTMTVDISNKGHEAETIPITVERNPSQNQMHLDLMTDEEIPPRGEISEYEESNASSILSEDSNMRSIGMFGESRRSPATVMHEHNVFVSRRKKSPKVSLPQQYMCYECPQVQVFSSLFELAEHKFESHQNKLLSNSTTVTISNEQDSAHILPEKIRRQSQTDEFVTSDNPLHELEESTVEPKPSVSTITPVPLKKEYFCVYCNFTAMRKTGLALHMETEHAGKPRTPTMFECTYCGKVFRARTNLRKHLLIHKERKYNCSTCSKGFTSNFKLIEHIRVHTKNYPYKCSSCDKTYRTPSLLNHHFKMVHLPEGERPPKRKLEFYCGICHRILHSKRSYMNHCLLHQEKPIKCSHCSETFSRHSVLVRHIRIAHDPQYESKESKDCPVCHKKLHPNSMIKHMRIHSNEKPYSCNVCGKHFRTYANLTSHSWSHTNVDKPHKCRQCSKSYLFKKNLDNHMMVHKKRTMHFVCNECGVKFTHKVNMKRHLEEHFKEKKHVCKVCGKAFQRHYYLVEHERIHSGVKPYTCNICGKASTTKSNHRAHLKIHDARETGNQEG